jgi:hypothetical protein
MRFAMVYCVLAATLLTPLRSRASGETCGAAGAFLGNGAGARAIAMGRSFSALADDGSALLWNPAGLAQLESPEFTASGGVLFEDRSQNYAGLAFPIGRAAVAAGWLRFGVAEIQERDGEDNLLGTFDDSESAFLLGGGLSALEDGAYVLDIGATIKYLRHSLHDQRATGLAGDVGVLFSMHIGSPLRRVSFGAVAQNLGGTVTWDTESDHEDDIPTTFRGGIAAAGDVVPLVVAVDVEKRGDEDVMFHAGAEYAWDGFALRAGIDDGELAGGIGYSFQAGGHRLVVDYAVTDDSVFDGLVHFGTLSVLF